MAEISKQVIEGPGVPPVLGPYSPGVRTGGLLFVSGQGGLDAVTGELAGEGFLEQARQAFRNVEAVLRAGGSRLDLVVSVTVLFTDFAFLAELNQVFAEFFPTDPPARVTMQVGLPGAVRISVACTAAVDREPAGAG
ncbi:MAG: Rid family hydrolase [Actinomycetota bacterium]|nr:Rid family hydrolase [Actinomycetota bacterium]